ncbi:hypothetical protein PHYPSEUDO_003114 [Phytophthora pseudosyringae]|uniref:Uncharacterized protein n=1 Tax=Phytophthora pseudosyringae TaxID=221518 RepID=A0A8T1WH96_9STRA|nr:hypothetical protein PHYPSEUDO_003114 [Phytophthora pseudosyringae]
MSGMHRFKSIYEDDSCNGTPTAEYDDGDKLIGYVEDSCHDGRGAGFVALLDDESYMAYDYTDYENSAAYRASGDCETLFDGYSPVRSATISVTSSGLVWTRNMGPIATTLGCAGAGAPALVHPATTSSMSPAQTLTTAPARISRALVAGFLSTMRPTRRHRPKPQRRPPR